MGNTTSKDGTAHPTDPGTAGCTLSYDCGTAKDTTPVAVEGDAFKSKDLSTCPVAMCGDLVESDYLVPPLDSDPTAVDPVGSDSKDSDTGEPPILSPNSVCKNDAESLSAAITPVCGTAMSEGSSIEHTFNANTT